MTEQTQPAAFAFDDALVRTSTRDDGEIIFVAQDVLRALDYSESSYPAKVLQSVPDEWKGVNPIHTLGGVQEVLHLTEQGLYFFICRSDKPKALPFQKWIAGEVIPSIRKTGRYSAPNAKAEIPRVQKIEQASRLARSYANASDPALRQNLGQLMTAAFAELGLEAPALTVAATKQWRESWRWILKTLLAETKAARFKIYRTEMIAEREVLIFRPAHFIDYLERSDKLRDEWKRRGGMRDRALKRALRENKLLLTENLERMINNRRNGYLVALDLAAAQAATKG